MVAEKSIRSNPINSAQFDSFFSALCHDYSFLFLTIKRIKLKLAQKLFSLNPPLLNKNELVVHKQCIDLLLVWGIFPMPNIKGAFERYQKELKAKQPKAKQPKAKKPKSNQPKAPLRRARIHKKKLSFSIPFFKKSGI
jgi:hypothetical protein